jgi:NADPH:quinone reductase-like Zn-dependent oxidoreductase
VALLVLTFPFLHAGTWQTYAVKPQELWHKVRNDVPMEYAATVTVNPLSALVLLQCFTKLNPGACPLPTCHPSTSIDIYISKKLYMLIPSFIILILLGDTIVQNGATSIVGQCVIQLAKAQGLRTINIIRDRYHPDLPPGFMLMALRLSSNEIVAGLGPNKPNTDLHSLVHIWCSPKASYV